MVIFINTDIAFEGKEPSTLVAKVITEIIRPGNIYAMGDAVQPPDITARPTPTTTKPR